MSEYVSTRLPSRIKIVLLDAVGTALTLQRSVAECYLEVANEVGIELQQGVIQGRFPTAFERNFCPWQSELPPDWRAAEKDWYINGSVVNMWLKAPTTIEQFASRFSFPVSESREYSSWAKLVSEVLLPVNGAGSSLVLDAAFQKLWKLFADPKSWRLMPGVTELVERLQALGLQVCLASNFDRRLHQIMAGFTRELRMDAIFVSSELGFRKPDPKFYGEVLGRIGCRAEEVAMVGDRWWEDFAAPTTVGISSFLLMPNQNPTQSKAADDRPECLRSLLDLLT
ncbi:MAG: HAD-IA family hydrolase [Planctomycetaceae bacterium]|nr:HAD-IA family hydrolase [Planctomycetaceae bacterium]